MADCSTPTRCLQHMMLRCTLALDKLLTMAAAGMHLPFMTGGWLLRRPHPIPTRAHFVKQLLRPSDLGCGHACTGPPQQDAAVQQWLDSSCCLRSSQCAMRSESRAPSQLGILGIAASLQVTQQQNGLTLSAIACTQETSNVLSY
jgi:hypothetical protein